MRAIQQAMTIDISKQSGIKGGIMNIGNLIVACGEMLNIDELINATFENEKLLLYGTEVKDHTINKMAKCVLYTIERIVQDYFPIKGSVKIAPKNKMIPYEEITNEKLIGITTICDQYGNGVMYEAYDKYIKVFTDAELTITYNYSIGENVRYDSVIDYIPPMITERAIIYGACYEYCLMNGRYDEANIYDVRFNDTILACTRGKGSKYIRPRIWR